MEGQLFQNMDKSENAVAAFCPKGEVSIEGGKAEMMSLIGKKKQVFRVIADEGRDFTEAERGAAKEKGENCGKITRKKKASSYNKHDLDRASDLSANPRLKTFRKNKRERTREEEGVCKQLGGWKTGVAQSKTKTSAAKRV